MRCKTHITDNTSSIGVCASCLHHRLLPLLAAATPPHPLLPRSVSPYIPRRKSTTTAAELHHHHHQNFPGQKFFSTPQIGPNGVIIDDEMEKKKNKKRGKFAIFSSLFKFRSGKVEESGIKCNMKINQVENCVISSSKYSENEYLDDNYRVESNKYSSEKKRSGNEVFEGSYRVESNYYSSKLRQTPKIGGRRSDISRNELFDDNYRVESNSSRNVSGIGFWMNPLVSKRSDWGRKGGD